MIRQILSCKQADAQVILHSTSYINGPMKLVLAIIAFTVSCSICLGQAPKNLEAALAQLDSVCDTALKEEIKITPDASLRNLFYPWKGQNKTVFEWFSKEKNAKILREYRRAGIVHTPFVEDIILISFKRKLLGLPREHEQLVATFRSKQLKLDEENNKRLTTDTIRGIYIPYDLEDCISQINSFWSDSTKAEVKGSSEREFLGKAHHGFGTWMRNNWQLWGGSRLSVYFNALGIHHPDDMSGIILTSYHRSLHGIALDLENQIRYYQEYWEKNKE